MLLLECIVIHLSFSLTPTIATNLRIKMHQKLWQGKRHEVWGSWPTRDLARHFTIKFSYSLKDGIDLLIINDVISVRHVWFDCNQFWQNQWPSWHWTAVVITSAITERDHMYSSKGSQKNLIKISFQCHGSSLEEHLLWTLLHLQLRHSSPFVQLSSSHLHPHQRTINWRIVPNLMTMCLYWGLDHLNDTKRRESNNNDDDKLRNTRPSIQTIPFQIVSLEIHRERWKRRDQELGGWENEKRERFFFSIFSFSLHDRGKWDHGNWVRVSQDCQQEKQDKEET